MCGIAVAIRRASDGINDVTYDALTAECARRGPDAQQTWSGRMETSGGAYLQLEIASSVLSLRGELQLQPLVGKRGVLAWNGQVLEGLEIPVDGNDTHALHEALEAGVDLGSLVGGIEGPYAFIYYEFATRTLSFGRDPFGRRSLLQSDAGEPMYLASVRSPGVAVPMREVSCESLWTLRLDDVGNGSDGQLDSSAALQALPRATDSRDTGSAFTRIPTVNSSVPGEGDDPSDLGDRHVRDFTDTLQASVRLRLDNIPGPIPGSARVAILFSGGIDCSFLAYLANSHVPPDEPIDLINVAFENPRSMASRQAQAQQDTRRSGPESERAMVDPYDVPDRLTGREAVAELRMLCPTREWRFVEVDVPYAEVQAARSRVKGLMYPNDTEMDLSLALPLYFAARGTGTLHLGGRKEHYQSAARVLISGLGADELLAGYSRHRRAFDQGSWAGAVEELQMDLDRLPTRNLGRDDRIISSHGRETRFPYLGMSFVAHTASLPVWHKIGPLDKDRRDLLADKLILRAACRRVGLVGAAERKKRAMQFGTRSARMEVETGGGKASRGMGARRIDD